MAKYDGEYVPGSAMAVFAHPDDAEFIVAGTLAAWARKGCAVTVVLVTSGDIGSHDTSFTRLSLAKVREREARAAAKALGVKRIVFLRRPDGEVVADLDLRRAIVREIRRHRPEVVMTHDPTAWFFDDRYVNHPDHRAAGTAALEAAFPSAEMELLWPRAGKAHRIGAIYLCASLAPNTWVDVTATIDAKIAALRKHQSQMLGWDPAPRILGWAEAEALRGGMETVGGGRGTKALKSGPTRYAEAFRVMRIRQRVETTE